MGVEYERYDDEDEYEYVEDYDDEREVATPGVFARFGRGDDREDERSTKKNQKNQKSRKSESKHESRYNAEPPRSSRSNRDYETYDAPRSNSPRRPSADSKILSLPGAYRNNSINAEEIVICSPETLEDARPVAEYLRNNIICVINLESVDKAVAQRIADFLGGVCDALDGGIQRISHDIFLIAPANIVITSQIREELKKSGLIPNFLTSIGR